MKQHKIGLGFALAVALGIAAPALAQQAVQWRVEDGGNGHWYARLARTSESWNALLATARIMGGDLASIASSSENAFVRSVAFVAEGSTGHAAIGAESPGGTCTVPWQWSDGTQFVFSNWDTDQPNCLPPWNEEVTLMYASGAWHDYPRTGYIGDWTSAVIEWSADCNGDGVVDYGQILDGTFADINSNGVPDCCDAGQSCIPCPGDITGGGVVDGIDLAAVLGAWGTSGQGKFTTDLNGDGTVDAGDLSIILAGWGPCPN